MFISLERTGWLLVAASAFGMCGRAWAQPAPASPPPAERTDQSYQTSPLSLRRLSELKRSGALQRSEDPSPPPPMPATAGPMKPTSPVSATGWNTNPPPAMQPTSWSTMETARPTTAPPVPVTPRVPIERIMQFRPRTIAGERAVRPDDYARLAQARVMLALLSDPVTFRCPLQVSASGSVLDVRGTVPNHAARSHALGLVERFGRMTVIDSVNIGPVPGYRRPPAKPEELRYDAVAALGLTVHGLQVYAQPDGRVILTGMVASYEEKLAASQRLHVIPGCAAVDNRIEVVSMPFEGRHYLLVSADGRYLIPDERPTSRPLLLPQSQPINAQVAPPPVALPPLSAPSARVAVTTVPPPRPLPAVRPSPVPPAGATVQKPSQKTEIKVSAALGAPKPVATAPPVVAIKPMPAPAQVKKTSNGGLFSRIRGLWHSEPPPPVVVAAPVTLPGLRPNSLPPVPTPTKSPAKTLTAAKPNLTAPKLVKPAAPKVVVAPTARKPVPPVTPKVVVAKATTVPPQTKPAASAIRPPTPIKTVTAPSGRTVQVRTTLPPTPIKTATAPRPTGPTWKAPPPPTPVKTVTAPAPKKTAPVAVSTPTTKPVSPSPKAAVPVAVIRPQVPMPKAKPADPKPVAVIAKPKPAPNAAAQPAKPALAKATTPPPAPKVVKPKPEAKVATTAPAKDKPSGAKKDAPVQPKRAVAADAKKEPASPAAKPVTKPKTTVTAKKPETKPAETTAVAPKEIDLGPRVPLISPLSPYRPSITVAARTAAPTVTRPAYTTFAPAPVIPPAIATRTVAVAKTSAPPPFLPPVPTMAAPRAVQMPPPVAPAAVLTAKAVYAPPSAPLRFAIPVVAVEKPPALAHPAVSSGVVVLASAEEPPSTIPPVAAAFLETWLRQRVATTCGNDARGLEVIFRSTTHLNVDVWARDVATAHRLAAAVLRMPELESYHVSLTVRVTP